MKSIRKTAFAGSFYPDSKEEILKYFEDFNKHFKVDETIEDFKTKAIIVPHAGYVYSGLTANTAYKIAKDKKAKRVILLGPSHSMYFKGASIASYDEYETPLGNINIDKNYINELKNRYDFLEFDDNMHLEHSTEVQAPFIKHYFSDASIIEIVYGDIKYEDLSFLIDEVLEDDDNILIVSTDLSHFYTQEKAKELDSICLNAIANKDLQLFEKGCEACGKIGVKAVINSAIKKGLDTKVLHYCTSYNRTKDASRVVGYVSALIGI